GAEDFLGDASVGVVEGVVGVVGQPGQRVGEVGEAVVAVVDGFGGQPRHGGGVDVLGEQAGGGGVGVVDGVRAGEQSLTGGDGVGLAEGFAEDVEVFDLFDVRRSAPVRGGGGGVAAGELHGGHGVVGVVVHPFGELVGGGLPGGGCGVGA